MSQVEVEEVEEEYNSKIALCFGASGQDASYMMELLLQNGYKVYGTLRRTSTVSTERIDHIFDKINLVYCDLTDSHNINAIIKKIKPTEIYNFAAMSHVKISSELENYTIQTNTLGILNILQAVRLLEMEKKCKIYHCSTSEMFGNETDGTQMLNEESKLNPVSMYGISKVAAYNICELYKNAYGMFVVSSFLFNHESERRGVNFVTQKIACYVGHYNSDSNIPPLQLGNLYAKRDWGYTKDYMEAVYLMMQIDIPENFVIASGESHTVKEFIELAFKYNGIIVEWQGNGLDEIGFDEKTKKTLVVVNPKYFRDIDIDCLLGDYSKAKKLLGWEPKTSFNELVNIMVEDSNKRKGNVTKIF